MSDLFFQIDKSHFEDVLDQFRKEMQKDINEAVGELAKITEMKILELAENGLHTTFDVYKANLTSNSPSAGVYVITLDQKAMWIEEGLPPDFDLKDGLLKNAKVSKAGYRYAVVPFKHNKESGQNTPKAQDLVDQVKSVLRQESIPFRKIEKNANGSPRLGNLHNIDIDSKKPTAKASTPALQSLRIYQNEIDENGKIIKKGETGKVAKKDKNGNNIVVKGIYTFRTATDSPVGKDKFKHPGLEAKLFMDKAFDYAMEKFDRDILPELLKKWGAK